MNVISTTTAPHEILADAVIVTHFADSPLSGAAAKIDAACGGKLTQLLEAKDLTGKKYEITQLPVLNGVQSRLVVVLGLGEKAKFDNGIAYRACSAAAKAISSKELKQVAYFPAESWTAEQHAQGIAGAMNGCVGPDLYKTKKSRFTFQDLAWSGPASALAAGKILGEAITLARRLVNEPANEIYPESFANEAVRVALENQLTIEVWDEARLIKERCGALLAVGRASTHPPRLVMLKYLAGPASQAPLALIGKGVTFDSGGLSLKPTDGMKTMKCDMAGAATVLATMQAIAQLKLPVNVIGFCGLVENMVGGSSFKLGDVLHARSGKTIEVLNTDAEGRLVLADVINVALDHHPAKMLDLATLTGACVVALGTDVFGVMSNEETWQEQVLTAARTAGEPAWPLPMFPEFSEHIKSEIADIKNTGDGRWGGAISAAKFLEEFVAETPWVHLDIAGPAFLESPKPWQDTGGSGVAVRTLVELIKGWK